MSISVLIPRNVWMKRQYYYVINMQCYLIETCICKHKLFWLNSFFGELHVMQMVLMGTDLEKIIKNKSPLTITQVYFALKTIVPVLEVLEVTAEQLRLISFEISVMWKAKPWWHVGVYQRLILGWLLNFKIFWNP